MVRFLAVNRQLISFTCSELKGIQTYLHRNCSPLREKVQKRLDSFLGIKIINSGLPPECLCASIAAKIRLVSWHFSFIPFQNRHTIRQTAPYPWATSTLDKASVRDEVSRLKVDFNLLNTEGKIPDQVKVLMSSMLLIMDWILYGKTDPLEQP